MALNKKYWLILNCFFILICFQQLFAQEDWQDSLDIQNPLPPVPDSLDKQIQKTQQTVHPPSLKEVEQKVINLETQFFDMDARTWQDDYLLYHYNNAYYFSPYQKNLYLLSNLTLNNFLYTPNELSGLLHYYSQKESPLYETKFETVSVPFEPMLTALQFSAGEHKSENKYLNLQKNNFLHLCNTRVFVHSGSYNSPWENKSYFDDFVLQLNRRIATHHISFHFIKQFSDQDLFMPFNRYNATELFPHYHRKFSANTGILDVGLFNDIFEFSFMRQSGYEKIVEPSIIPDKYEVDRNQLVLGLSTPGEIDKIKILWGLDSNQYKNFKSIREDSSTDYFINLYLTSPGFWELSTVKVLGQVYFSDIFDTTFIYTHLSYDIPIGASQNLNLGMGSIGNPHSTNALESGILYYEERKNPLSNFAGLSWNLKKSSNHLEITPYIVQTRYDYQWVLQDSLVYQSLDDYVSGGIKGEADIEYNLFGLPNRMRLRFNFTNWPDTLVFRPNFKLKFTWNIKKDTGYNNFVYLAPSISYIKDFRNMKLTKESNELFFDLEFGINISRFRISASIKNILNQEYFMDPEYLINERSAHFKVHWNFIN
ncbi:MAG: hypothetical protein ACP5EQ_04140 [Candidatus Cloacimonadia bacterium]